MRLPLCVVIAAFLIPSATAQWAGEWNLDEKSGTTANDISGNANHGTLKNFGTAPWVTGKFGNALSFDGVDDYVDVGIKKGLPIYDGLGSPYTVACIIGVVQGVAISGSKLELSRAVLAQLGN